MSLVTGFIAARNYTRAEGRKVNWVVLHAMQAPEKPGTAKRVAQWFAGSTAPRASAHYNLDDTECWQSVKDKDVAWGASGVNRGGIHLEHAGYSEQSAADWSDPFSTRMLHLSARLTAEKCRERNLPIRFVFADGIKRGEPGITTHAQAEKAFPSNGHWDPGLYFPVVHYLDLVRFYSSGEPTPTHRAPDRIVFSQEVDVATIQVVEVTAPGTDANGNGYVDVGEYGKVGDVSLIQGGYPSDPNNIIRITGRQNWAGVTRVYFRGPANHPHFGVLVERW